jgi:dipeptidyl-peptidase-4
LRRFAAASPAQLAGCLWELDLGSGKERLLADASALLGGAQEELPPEEMVRRERSRQQGRGIVDYSTDRELRLAVFALSGDVWVVDTASGAARQVTRRGSVVDPPFRYPAAGSANAEVTLWIVHQLRAAAAVASAAATRVSGSGTMSSG